jgi:arylsulfatase A-like enzyme
VLRETGLDQGELDVRPEDVRFWRAVYDEKIQRADAKLRHFFDELDRLGLLDQSLVVVTSDHGTEFFEHRRIDHGFSLYNEQLRVPLLLKLPGQTAGLAIGDRVSSIDLMPTLLDLLQCDPVNSELQPLRGTSLVKTMQGQPAQRDVFSETDYRQFTFQRAIVTADGWKLIYTLESRSRELFNLNDDPGERVNLAKAEPQRADELEAKLFAHFAALGHDLRSQRWERGFNPVYDFPAK